ncbi:MAG: HD domain-containing protein [Planctomycetia bacterium]|nr:HD domain-containing protein [Planctomycetia bacterium]
MYEENYFESESLSQDAVHGYISFSSPTVSLPDESSSERELIDSPWVQRLRQIHQLQTAWLVYPTAEHSRFQHVLGTMHLASRVWHELRDSFYKVFQDDPDLLEGESLPSPAFIESLLRVAGLLHDVGHGPFGHFFDRHFLSQYKTPGGHILTHETLGGEIIRRELAPLIRGIRRNPNGVFNAGEQLDPDLVAFLIIRPRENDTLAGRTPPLWLNLLRGLFSGLYTIDNMDFVLRDSYMAGFGSEAFDFQRLLHYSFFTKHGLTLHRKGLASLIHFLNAREELFHSLYFHRKVRAADLALSDLFQNSAELLYPWGSPCDSLDRYLHFTEWSLLTDVDHWHESQEEKKRSYAVPWRAFLQRKFPWHLLAEKSLVFQPGDRTSGTIFANESLFAAALRDQLPPEIHDAHLAFDLARTYHRPGSTAGSAQQNFLYDPSTNKISRLESEDSYRAMPKSSCLCRVYGTDPNLQQAIARALGKLTEPDSSDDLTNM